ncbi:hypothetical protein LCGC14_0632270 [marine sediment metagenome]|uniref:Uncharacterized protein n=1 Tax=marine sediment metagenome TaxID=412755 RepID=A0A0F9RL24_9ZZZZ
MSDRTIRRGGLIALLTKARREFDCDAGHDIIGAGDHYWRVTIGGGGIRSESHPWHVCVMDINPFLDRGGRKL